VARRRASISDVAADAGVSVSTVSRILNGIEGRATPETVARVNEAALRLDYRPALAARALRTNESRLVAVLIPNITSMFNAIVVSSIEAELARTGFSMILYHTRESAELQDQYLDEMHAHGVRAAVILGVIDSEGLRRARARGIRLVFTHRRPPAGIGAFVGIDNHAAGRAVGEYFASQGYRDTIIIQGVSYSSTSRERVLGFSEVFAEHGIPFSAERIHECDFTPMDAYRIAARVLVRGRLPRAVFCTNDQIAYGVMRRLRELDVETPGAVAVFGFDDNPLNEWLAPWLSTVSVPSDLFGPAVAELLAAGASEDGEILLPFTMRLRQSA
jgi:LacI family transcriptional regulator